MENESWFCMEVGGPDGPFTREEIIEKIAHEHLKEQTYVRLGVDGDWKKLRDTSLAEFIPESLDRRLSGMQDGSDASDLEGPWFYTWQGETAGPCTSAQMRELLKHHEVTPNTYVYSAGTKEWRFLKATSLGEGLPGWQRPGNSVFQTPRSCFSLPEGIDTRNILVACLLSVITVSVYYFFWLYRVIAEINDMALHQGRKPGPSPVIALVLTICTLGLYQIWLFWKEERLLSSLHYSFGHVKNQSGLCAGLCVCFLAVISLSILQEGINEIVQRELSDCAGYS